MRVFEEVQEVEEEIIQVPHQALRVQLRHIFSDSGFTPGGWFNCCAWHLALPLSAVLILGPQKGVNICN